MIKNIPKIELHLHLDGSAHVEMVKDLLHIEEDITDDMVVKNTCDSLDSYLGKFTLPIKAMQTKESLEKIAFALTEDLQKENVVYAEIRFAPMLHTKKGLTMEEVVLSVLKGLQKGRIKTNLILCMMRGESFSVNKSVIDLARKFFKKGVCAVDLAGSEAKYPVTLYKELLVYARKHNIPFTIHAGEASGSESVRNAILQGASRIGHGIHILEDDSLIKEIIDKRILLEVCPTSNVQTGAVDVYQNHPIRKLYDKGVLVHVNTDNRTVSNITLTKEYEKLMDYFSFTEEDFIKMNEDAIGATFLSQEEKKDLYNLFHKNLS